MQTGSLQQPGAASGRPWRSILEMQGSDGSGVVPGFPSGPRSDGLFAASGRGITARWAWGVFAVLFLVHLLESLDRWQLPAVLRPLSEELELTDAQAGWLATVLLISYALWGPFAGRVDGGSRPGDRGGCFACRRPASAPGDGPHDRQAAGGTVPRGRKAGHRAALIVSGFAIRQ